MIKKDINKQMTKKLGQIIKKLRSIYALHKALKSTLEYSGPIFADTILIIFSAPFYVCTKHSH